MGLLPGDYLLSINGEKIISGINARSALTRMLTSSERIICIFRNGEEITCQDIQSEDNNIPNSVGVVCSLEKYANFNWIERAKYGVRIASLMIKETINGILELFKNFRLKNFSGFIGILRAGVGAAQESFASLVATFALISVNLAIVNLLPLPILDGGQVLILGLSKIYGRPLGEKFQKAFFYFSILLIGLLTIFTTFYDIVRWIGWA